MNQTIPGVALALTLFSCPSIAQWPSDPAVNLPVADAASDQILPKIAPTSDGGCYISWFDGLANGFDVRLQRLDALGNELWAHDGVLVADRGFTSVQDYGLDVDANDAALITFRDDRFTGVQITAQRVTGAGVLVWGVNGVQLTSTNDFVASPKIAGTADGDAVVAWTQNGTARVMRLHANGGAAWAAPVDLAPGGGQYTVSDLHDSGVDALLSIVHQTGSITSPKHLLAQKLDHNGAFLWGASPVAVFDGGSLQIGNFPPFVPDGSGGAVFAWYGVSPLQCYAQRVLANGTEAFPHNGSVGSTNASNVRVSPAVAFDAASSSTFLFWKEQNSGQSQSGLSGQKFDAAGAAQWGAAGETLIAVGGDQVDQVRTLTNGGAAYVFWIASAGFGLDSGVGAVVDAAGDFVVSPLEFSSTQSGKSRLAAAKSSTGQALLAWSDDRDDAGDVLAQNFQADGTLGNGAVHTPYCYGVSCPCGNDDPNAGCANRTGSGALLTGLGAATFGADTFRAVATNAIPGQPGLFFQGAEALNGGAGLPFGDGLRCTGTNVIRLVTVVPDGSGCAATDASCGTVVGGTAGPISTNPAQSGAGAAAPGDTRYYQFWYRDPAVGPCGNDFNLSNAIQVDWN